MRVEPRNELIGAVIGLDADEARQLYAEICWYQRLLESGDAAEPALLPKMIQRLYDGLNAAGFSS